MKDTGKTIVALIFCLLAIFSIISYKHRKLKEIILRKEIELQNCKDSVSVVSQKSLELFLELESKEKN